MSDYPTREYALKKEEYIMVEDKLVLERHWVAMSGNTDTIVFTERRTCPNGSWETHTEFALEEDK